MLGLRRHASRMMSGQLMLILEDLYCEECTSVVPDFLDIARFFVTKPRYESDNHFP